MNEEIQKIKDSLIGNYSDYFDIFCSKCWSKDNFTFHGDRNDKIKLKAAKAFYMRGWLITEQGALCPHCKKSESDDAKKVIGSLTDRERESLEKRFGKIDKNTDFGQIGQDLEATRRKIKEIEAKALRKLRKSNDVPPDDIA